MSRFQIAVIALLCAPVGAIAADNVKSADPPIRKLNGMLVDSKGRGIYTWDGDKTLGVSSCNGQCRLLWPPIFAGPDAVPKDPFTLVRREDGRVQWALRGRPLYRWASDKKFGDAGGDGVNDTWRLVRVPKPKAMPLQATPVAPTRSAP